MEKLPKLFRTDTEQIGTIIIDTYREYRGNAVRWSAVYFGCLFGSAFLSAMAALILKFELLSDRPKLKNDLAASLATVAALLVTLSTTGDFQRKWHANRMAASAMENLAYELARTTPTMNLDSILTRIQEINSIRNQEIVGEASESESKEFPVLPNLVQPNAQEDAAKTAHP
jgi:hypothetical protein